LDASLPFGGFKEAAEGCEMGGAVFNKYMATKTVITDLGGEQRRSTSPRSRPAR
jgi:acyl-CoA reductase-like NAD-dependent aldehyde dehydrogenase